MPTREVTESEFYSAIGGKNVHPDVVGPFPYTSIFRTPDRTEHGRVVEELTDGNYPIVRRYYLT